MKHLRLFIFVALAAVLFSTCKRKQLSWDSDVLLPLLSGRVNMQNILADSLLEAGDDSLLKVVYRNELYNFNFADEVIAIPDTALDRSFSLDSIQLEDRSITHNISLGTIALQAGAIGAIIIANDSNNAIIPSIGPIGPNIVNVDGTDFFENATLDSGFMDIRVVNGLPIEVSVMEFELSNKVSGDLILTHTFTNIPAGGSDSVTVDLAGKTIEGTLVANIIQMSSPGSNGLPVLIDTTDVIELHMTIRDLKIFEATAIFPAQNLIDHEENVSYTLNGPEFTFFRVRSGYLKVTLQSTVEDTIYFTYAIPGAIDGNGIPLTIISKLPPAPPGGIVSIDEIYDLKDYEWDLTGKNGDTVNTFYNTIIARIDSTGKKVHLSLNDSVTVFYGLLDIVPEYVEGYMGQARITVGPEAQDFDLYKGIKSGSFDLESVDINLIVENNTGVAGAFMINNLSTINTKTNTSVTLTGDVPGKVINITRALDNPLTASVTQVSINNSNSNATELIENFSDRFSYFADMFINVNVNNPDYKDFAYFDSGLMIALDIEMPLSFIANQLILTDTLDFNFDRSTSSGKINQGNIYLLADNGFPLEVDIQIMLYNDSWQLLDSLFSNSIVKAGELDANCRVSAPTRSKLGIPVNDDRFDVFDQATKGVIWARFNTSTQACNGTYLKIFSDYFLDVTMVGDFNYQIGDKK